MRIRDPGLKKNSDPGTGMEKSRIRCKHPGSATLMVSIMEKLDQGHLHPLSTIEHPETNMSQPGVGPESPLPKSYSKFRTE
jgi:hypothetical protein